MMRYDMTNHSQNTYIKMSILYIYIYIDVKDFESEMSKVSAPILATPVRFPAGACWELQNDDLYNVFRTSLFFGPNSFRRQTSILAYT